MPDPAWGGQAFRRSVSRVKPVGEFVSGECYRWRRRREFVTTETLESAIAAAAIMGWRRPRAATGIASVL